MANKDAAFGLKPIGKVGQNGDNNGLSEYDIAASASAIYFQDPVEILSTGTIGVAAATDALLGSLNGVFFTDATTSKPTFANHLNASNTATDIKGFVTDDPYQRYEIQSDGATAAAGVAAAGGLRRSQTGHLASEPVCNGIPCNATPPF